MNLQQLEYAVTIERYSSFNKAAQALFISQPALSFSIRELEKEIGFSIFTRTNKGSKVTDEGKIFLSSAKEILLKMHELQHKYNNTSTEDAPVVRISSGRYSFITYALIEFYNTYLSSTSNFSIYVNETDTHQTIDDVLNKKSEIGIIHVKNNNNNWKELLQEKGIEYSYLFQSHACIIVRKNHPLTYRKNITYSDLFNFPLIHTVGFDSIYNNYDNQNYKTEYGKFEKRIYTNNRTFVYDYLRNSDAIYIGVTNLSITNLQPSIVTLPLPSMSGSIEKDTWDFYYVKLKLSPLTSNTKLFLETIKNLFAKEDTEYYR